MHKVAPPRPLRRHPRRTPASVSDLQRLGSGAQFGHKLSFRPLRLITLHPIQLFYSKKTMFWKLPLTSHEQNSTARPHRLLLC